MSKTRKILGFVMAIALILNVVAMAAFAADDTTYTNEWALASDAFTTTPTVGSTFTVAVQLKADYYLGPVQFAIDYDSAKFSIADTGAIDFTGYPYAAIADYHYDTAAKRLYVSIVPDTAGLTTLDAVKLSALTTIATITFTYNAPGTMVIANDYKTDANLDGSVCAYRSLQSDLLQCTSTDLVYGQTPTIPESKTVGEVAIDLVLKSGVTGIVIDKSKKFGGAYDGAVYGFPNTATNYRANANHIINNLEYSNGTAITTANITTGFASVGYGTGAVIKVVNASGTVLKQYVVVIFGDINGDGLMNATDTTLCKAAITATTGSSNYIALNSVKRLAANCYITSNATVMHNIQANDSTQIKLNAVAGTRINQVNIAAKHVTYNTFYQ